MTPADALFLTAICLLPWLAFFRILCCFLPEFRQIGFMNRRQFAATGLAAGGILFTGCAPDHPKPSAALKDDLGNLDTAICGLESSVGDLAEDNWKDLLPNLKSEAAQVRSAFYRVRDALGDE